jgi:hypothetical protein
MRVAVLLATLLVATVSNALAAESATSAVLIVVKVPGSVSPTERVANYDEPLEVALSRESLGKVIGGGADLTVEVVDFARGPRV